MLIVCFCMHFLHCGASLKRMSRFGQTRKALQIPLTYKCRPKSKYKFCRIDFCVTESSIISLWRKLNRLNMRAIFHAATSWEEYLLHKWRNFHALSMFIVGEITLFECLYVRACLFVCLAMCVCVYVRECVFTCVCVYGWWGKEEKVVQRYLVVHEIWNLQFRLFSVE